ncbi:MAG: LysM repeat protein [Sphingobacteriales bacterium]|jgi:LysM repeat protein
MNFNTVDSIGTKIINGKIFVIHKVDAKQTFYSISRIYNCDVKELMRYNPRENNALPIDDILYIPTNRLATGEKADDKSLYHVVKPKETLYSISQLHRVPVEKLKELNNISSIDLTIGQDLLIKKSKAPEMDLTLQPLVEKDTVGNYLEIKEVGLVQIVDTLSYSGLNQLVAYHPIAKIGTVIKLTNELNNKTVFVKVIGRDGRFRSLDNAVMTIPRNVATKLGSLSDYVLGKSVYTSLIE